MREDRRRGDCGGAAIFAAVGLARRRPDHRQSRPVERGKFYDEGPSLEDWRPHHGFHPLSVAKRSSHPRTQQAKKLDKDLLDGLERKGFRLDFGEDGTGWQFKYLIPWQWQLSSS
jgi:hypothetical protein